MIRCLREQLIIFTRYPTPGQTKTRMIPLLGETGAAELQRQMTGHLLSNVRGLAQRRPLNVEIRFDGGNRSLMQNWLGPEFVYRRQDPGDLGRRMARALADAFDCGVDQTVLIGSDIPGITTEILQRAFEGLAQTDLVFGPANDGGYYLIGMQKAAIDRALPELFSGISWGTAKVLSQTLAAVANSGLTFFLLDRLDDVDRPEDLPVWERISGLIPTASPRGRISVIIPTLNEAGNITQTLSLLGGGRNLEIIVVDGGSEDGTVEKARSMGATVLTTTASKARQMNSGAAAASGDILVFLHADTQLPVNFEESIQNSLAQNRMAAGAFRLRIDSEVPALRFIERVANWRARRLQMPYGDQAIFVSKALFDEIGGFPDFPIMEDFELIRRLRKKGTIFILPQCVLTSPRRWLYFGVFKTWLMNQAIIAGYYLGIPPERLARWYRRHKGLAPD
ncbi:MAG: TIGR04283 family arsenosugar biosynthesis glycosyltransferase [Desulfobacterales bacterium]|nr:MAG: TIGR04283 family arsenosugar biosynthesis glycosyltransferase [Desulfobacterales bacterium]